MSPKIIQHKIEFLNRKLAQDLFTTKAIVAWVVFVLILAAVGVIALHLCLPEFQGKTLTAWVSPGALGISLPAPIREFFKRRQSMIAVQMLRDEYANQPSPDRQRILDRRFNALFEKLINA